jgi:hypothetical protein
MAITYTWKLTGLKKMDKGGIEGLVFQTYWKKIGTDENGNTGEFVGATPIPADSVVEDDFIPYEQLTEEIVLSWVKPIVVGSYESHVNGVIAKQIEEKVSPTVQVDENQLPWADPVTPTPPMPDPAAMP